MMFDGLRSRWTTPAACAKATGSAMRSNTPSAAASPASAAACCGSVSPRTYFIT